ncbi:MAG: CDP-alcohol phosphatidyltransferase family protein [Candidatus Omnitrophota bacterium]
MTTLANKLSILRILLIPVFIGSVLYYTPEKDFLRLIALGVFILAIITDALDGYIARIRGERGQLGAFLDPLADKLLLITVYICLAATKTLPMQFRLAPWVVIVVLSRDAIIVLGSVLIYMATTQLKIAPTILGKLTTFLQMAAIVALLLQLKLTPLIMCFMVFFTVLSGLDYIRLGTRQFNGVTVK